MPRKIKVVDVAENQIVVKSENVITDIPNSESIDVPQPETINPVIIPDEVADEILKEVEIDKNNNDSKTGTCSFCKKTMLLKNLKYAHPKVCKNRPPPETVKVYFSCLYLLVTYVGHKVLCVRVLAWSKPSP